ncbi:farnesol dehydrogenase-like [Vanessa tameamea]|uniref:Farnesol dehydrogenase-like n=1 Tax=Vanessa tameamea TaxID=334116 RepID=A0A8B8HXY7_VANTA|nr:farnesol dehydrogenase-like [Vanessa tameamea]
MERWSSKVAIVTGASSGIGAALSLRLANHGLTVVGLARRTHLIDELASKVTGDGRIVTKSCDISKPEDIDAAFQWVEQKIGGPHVLVNNAGVLKTGCITDAGDNPLSDDAILSTLDVNLKGMIMCTRKAVSSMRKRNFNGHIINVNSIAGHYVPFKSSLNVYPSTKHAVTAFTTALNTELAEFNCQIKVASVSPGLVKTDMVTDFKDDMPILEPEAVADAILYILSTPPKVNITELTIESTLERRL